MRKYFKPILFVCGLLLLIFGCQKDDTPVPNEETQIESLSAFNLSAREIPSHILDFVKAKS
ncbi:MAG: hypothetical protein ACJARX_001068 [Psychroserpens sp.]|jgi:hypothetical protein